MNLLQKGFLHAALFGMGCFIGFTYQATSSIAPSAASSERPLAEAAAAASVSTQQYKARQPGKKTAKDFNSLALADFPDALRRTLAHPIPAERKQWLAWLFAAWARVDRLAALQALAEVSSPQAQAEATAAILREWVQIDSAAAWRWATSLPAEGSVQVRAIDTLLAASASSVPQHYAAWAGALEDPLLRARSLSLVAGQWAQRDLPKAIEWMRTLEPKTLRSALIRDQVLGSNQLSSIAKLELARAWPDFEVRTQGAAMLLETLAREDAKAAINWLVVQPMTADLQLLCSQLGGALASQLSVAEARAIAGRLMEGPLRNGFLAGVAGARLFGVSPNDPDKSKALLPLIGPGLERLLVLADLGEVLANRQQAQAEAWVQTFPQGIDRDAAIGGLALSLVRRKQPALALDWLAQTTTGLTDMDDFFERTFRDWRKADPGRAIAWLNSTPRLDDDQRLRLRALPLIP